MTKQQELELVQTHEIKSGIPKAMQPKSWLIVFCNSHKELKMYDTEKDIVDAFKRLSEANPGYCLVQVLPFSSQRDAKEFAGKIREFKAYLKFLDEKMEKEIETAFPDFTVMKMEDTLARPSLAI